jgi:hypothetical protein
MNGLKPEPAALLQEKDGKLIFRRLENKVLAAMDIELLKEQRLEVIRTRHDDKIAGHPGIVKTIELITRDYVWKGLRKDVEGYVKNCDTYHKSKHARHKLYRLLQTPEYLERPWARIAMDFIVKLPLFKEPLTGTVYNSILTINDDLIKYIYLLLYKESSTAEELAYAITRTVFAQYGTPEIIIIDRDKLFNSQFW